MNRRRLGRAAPRWGAVLVSSLLALGAAELVLRLRQPEPLVLRIDPRVEHSYRPLLQVEQSWGPLRYPLVTNSLGWRDDRPGYRVPRRTPHGERIVFLGDSFTEGLGYAQARTPSGVAAGLLRAAGRDCEVLNGGMTSYCPLLEWLRLRQFLADGYRADTVVLLPDLSDSLDELTYRSRCTFDSGGEPAGFSSGLHAPLRRALANHSALFRRLATSRLGRWVSGRQGEPEPLDDAASFRLLAAARPLDFAACDRLSPAAREALRAVWPGHLPSLRGWAGEGVVRFREDLERIRRLCAEKRLRLVVVLYPWPSLLAAEATPAARAELRRRSPQLVARWERVLGGAAIPAPSAYEAAVRRFCADQGVPLLDLFPLFAGDPRWPELFVPGDVHFSARGDRLVGEAIAQHLLKHP